MLKNQANLDDEEEPDFQAMVEQYMNDHKNQFDVFDYEEDGSFKPIFMVGKCQPPEEASSPILKIDIPEEVPETVIEEEEKEPANIEIGNISV